MSSTPKPSLSLEALVLEVAATEVTEAKLAALRERLSQSERDFIDKARARSQSEFLDRTYSI